MGEEGEDGGETRVTPGQGPQRPLPPPCPSLNECFLTPRNMTTSTWGKALFQESVLNPPWLLHSWWLTHSLNPVCFQPGPELLLLLIPGRPQRQKETEVALVPPSTPRM